MGWNEITSKLIEVLFPLLLTLLSALITYAVVYIKKKTEAIENENIQNLVWNALDEAEKVAQEAVLATNQKFVDNIKKAREDNKLTWEEATQAYNMAEQYFLSHISTSSKEVLEQLFGDLTNWLKDYIEAQLAKSKTYQAVK